MDGMDLKIARIRAHLTLWELGRLAGVHPARMTGIIYVVTVRGLIPESLPRKVIEAHAGALTSAQRQKQK